MLRFQAVSMSVDDVSLKCPYSRADGLSRSLGCIVTEPAQKEAVGQPTVYKERFLLQMAKRAQHGNI